MSLIFACFLFVVGAVVAEAPDHDRIYEAPHLYLQRAVHDPFTRLKQEQENGQVELDRSGEKPFLRSLLKALHVPEQSQVLVFSTTSLQLSLVTPANPRALYFNEEVYICFIPG